jgi:hypothetical protein
MKATHPITPTRSADLRFSVQALLAVGIVVSFVLLLHLT